MTDNPFENVEPAALDEVDAPAQTTTSDEIDDVPAAAGGSENKDETPAKEKKPARPPVAEGYITPVQFSKELTKHLHAQGATNRAGGRIGGDGEECDLSVNPITSQMVYSYINNSLKPGAKNPFPVYKDADKTGGRDLVLVLAEGLAWWDEKNGRVAASKQKAAEKATKAAEKSTEKKSEDAPVSEAAGPVEEAE